MFVNVLLMLAAFNHLDFPSNGDILSSLTQLLLLLLPRFIWSYIDNWG